MSVKCSVVLSDEDVDILLPIEEFSSEGFGGSLPLGVDSTEDVGVLLPVGEFSSGGMVVSLSLGIDSNEDVGVILPVELSSEGMVALLPVEVIPGEDVL